MRVNVGQRVTAGVLTLALALTPCAPIAAQSVYGSAASRAPPPPPPPPPPSRGPYGHPQRPHGPSLWPWLLAGAVAAGVCYQYCGQHDDRPSGRAKDNDEEPDREDLLQNGPHVSDTAPLGGYAVYGFVRNGWPIVVDYDTADPEAAVVLTIYLPGKKPWTQGLEGGRHYVNVPYRGGGADRSTPALFTLHAQTRGYGPSQPVELTVLGVGCGPRAVGSVAIHDLSFAPSARKFGGDYAHFGYQASSPFNRVGMEILRFEKETRAGAALVTATSVASYGQKAVLAGPFGPRMWDGRVSSSGKDSHGVHRLQVRGWETDDDESWVAAISADQVFIR